MTDPAFIISFVVLFVFCVYVGFSVGNTVGERTVTTREYWGLNVAVIAVCMLVTAMLGALPLLYAVPVGLMAGGITGLKMGFGESVGPWAFIDRFFNINRAHRDTTKGGVGEARRRRRREGASAPDVISVTTDTDASASGHSSATAGGARRPRRPAKQRKKR